MRSKKQYAHIGAQAISVLIFIGAVACAARKVYIFKLKCGVECKRNININCRLLFCNEMCTLYFVNTQRLQSNRLESYIFI